MVKDNVSDLIVSLKNASAVGKDSVVSPYTKMNHSILEVLKKEGYITDVEKQGKDLVKRLNITLKYEEGQPKISDIKRVSKFSRRVYQGFKDIRAVKRGYGLLVLSTPKGIMGDKQARKEKVGGEALFEIS